MKLHFIIIAITVFYLNEIKCNPESVSNVSISAVCDDRDKVCLWKCCPPGQYLKRRKTCAADPAPADYSNLTVYDLQLDNSEKSFEDAFQLVYGIMSNNLFFTNSFYVGPIFKPYLMEDGNLYLEKPNTLIRWRQLPRDHFCVELSFKSRKPLILVELIDEETYMVENLEYALALSIGFLLTTLAPYCLCPLLRGLNGAIVVTFILFHMVPLVLTLISLYNVFSAAGVIAIALFYHFFSVSSFCWTNIMFYRIRESSSDDLPPSRKRQLVQYLKYCGYTVVFPLVLTSLVAAAEHSDLTHVPWLITPQIIESGNYLFTAKEAVVYLYAPLALLLMVNWGLCIQNLTGHYQNTRTEATTPPTEGLEHPLNRPSRYMSLVALQTCQVVIQALSAYCPDGIGPVLVQALFVLNLGLGPALFLIFVINKNVLEAVRKYFAQRQGRSYKIMFKSNENAG